ncbi:MAG: NAD(P)H-binding protein, partial [Hyphomicrobiaceae bacterium]
MSQGQQQDVVTVFGGSGFVGSRIVAHLVAGGIATRVAVRHPMKASASLAAETAQHAAVVYTDVCNENSVATALDNAIAAVNTVGLYVESRTETFEAVHEIGAQSLARQCAAMGVAQLVHLSGIGADVHSPSRYV